MNVLPQVRGQIIVQDDPAQLGIECPLHRIEQCTASLLVVTANAADGHPHVFMIDFSYQRPVMEQLLADVATLTVLDHHKSAQEDLDGLGGFIEFDMERSGAMMAWGR